MKNWLQVNPNCWLNLRTVKSVGVSAVYNQDWTVKRYSVVAVLLTSPTQTETLKEFDSEDEARKWLESEVLK